MVVFLWSLWSQGGLAVIKLVIFFQYSLCSRREFQEVSSLLSISLLLSLALFLSHLSALSVGESIESREGVAERAERVEEK